MFWIGLLIGLIIGAISGVAFCAFAQLLTEKTAVENKIIKLEGKYYEITEVAK